MLAIALVINTLIGVTCLVVAWQLWLLKARLAQVTHTLSAIERNVFNILHPAPETILKGQVGVRSLRESYKTLGPKLERIERSLSLLKFALSVWQRPRLRTSLPRRS